MKYKICNICNKNKVYSKTKSFCSECRYNINLTLNINTSNIKECLRKLYSTHNYDKEMLYSKLKESIDTINQIQKQHYDVVLCQKGRLEFIEYANAEFNKFQTKKEK